MEMGDIGERHGREIQEMQEMQKLQEMQEKKQREETGEETGEETREETGKETGKETGEETGKEKNTTTKITRLRFDESINNLQWNYQFKGEVLLHHVDKQILCERQWDLVNNNVSQCSPLATMSHHNIMDRKNVDYSQM